jgi:hypothetical protein
MRHAYTDTNAIFYSDGYSNGYTYRQSDRIPNRIAHCRANPPPKCHAHHGSHHCAIYFPHCLTNRHSVTIAHCEPHQNANSTNRSTDYRPDPRTHTLSNNRTAPTAAQLVEDDWLGRTVGARAGVFVGAVSAISHFVNASGGRHGAIEERA